MSDDVNADNLRAFIERIERIEEEIAALGADRKDIYAEAKSSGFDVKIMRRIVAIRKQDRDKWREDEEIFDLYMAALGMLSDLPLGQAAVDREFPRRVA